jgi:hypothetical protein
MSLNLWTITARVKPVRKRRLGKHQAAVLGKASEHRPHLQKMPRNRLHVEGLMLSITGTLQVVHVPSKNQTDTASTPFSTSPLGARVGIG